MQVSESFTLGELDNAFFSALRQQKPKEARAIQISREVSEKLSQKGSLSRAEKAAINPLPDMAEIVAFFENKFKFSFEWMHKCDDDSYIVHWHEYDRKLENIRVTYVNNWLHEKVRPLINDLPGCAEKHGLILDMLTQPVPGRFSGWMITPDYKHRIYFSHQVY